LRNASAGFTISQSIREKFSHQGEEMPADEGSVSGWVSQLQAGDAAAAQRLWDRYLPHLVQR
jgi:hypothetical protein